MKFKVANIIPAFPTISVQEAAREIVLEESSWSEDGVYVPVHVVESLLDIVPKLPEFVSKVKSALANDATASEKTIVRVVDSPMMSVLSPIAIDDTVGARVSTAKA